MTYFSIDFISFFKELANNNNKDWFHDNKKRYENSVKKPMLQLVTDVIIDLRKKDDSIDIDPRKCIGRINRDIRFSNDKSPYKTKTFARIYKGNKMDQIPVIAFQMGADEMGIMSGFYTPPNTRIAYIRNKISANPKTFKALYSSAEFVSHFGEIRGDKIKRIPPELKIAHTTEPLIANKQFYYAKSLSSDILMSPDLLPTIIEYYEAAQPLNQFLS
jgi:uncharacterized protein (TIGR02453 family)